MLWRLAASLRRLVSWPSWGAIAALCLLLGSVADTVAQPQPPLPISTTAAATNAGHAAALRILSPADGSVFHQMAVQIRMALQLPGGRKALRVLALLGERTIARVEPSDGGPRGLRLLPGSMDGDLRPGEALVTLAVTLPAEDVLLRIRADLDDGSSVSAALHLRWEGLREVPIAPPKLYVLSIGVSSYQIPEYALTYPAKDAHDISLIFEKQRGRLYRDVSTRLLVDRNATKSAILDGLEWIQRQTTSRDVAVLFMAGHGIVDPSTGRYFFLPHDADPDAIKRTMLSQDDVQTTLRAIAGKVLVFLDSCHSGKVLGPEATRGQSYLDNLISELVSADNGVVVFTASIGRQQSKESPRWGNGAFTKAVLEGLEGRAALVPGRPITVAMLDLYISERVKVLTAGTQTPATAKPSTLPDFPIALPPSENAPAPTLIELALQSEAHPTKKRPVYKAWWLWTLVGGVGAGALATALAVALRPEELPIVEPMAKK